MTDSGFTISDPGDGDEVSIGPIHLQSWHESYVSEENGVSHKDVDDAVAFLTTPGANKFRHGVFALAKDEPNENLYKVVRGAGGSIVGFMHATKNDTYNELEGIYLLDVAKGAGIGENLMNLFLNWSNPQKQCHLEVIAFNSRAQHFYEKFGFTKTSKEVYMFKDKFPVIEMVRPVRNA